MKTVDDEFRKLYLENIANLVCYASRYVDGTTAEDIVQEAYLRVYEKYTLKLCTDDALKILFRIVRNLCIDIHRHEASINDIKMKLRAQLVLEEMEAEPDVYLTEKDENLLNKVNSLIKNLPQRKKEIFDLYYSKGLKTNEIADELKLSKRTIENTLYRTLITIRKECVGICITIIFLLGLNS